MRAGTPGHFHHAFQQMVRTLRAIMVDDRLQRLDPLPRLLRIGVVLQHFVEPIHCALHSRFSSKRQSSKLCRQPNAAVQLNFYYARVFQFCADFRIFGFPAVLQWVC